MHVGFDPMANFVLHDKIIARSLDSSQVVLHLARHLYSLALHFSGLNFCQKLVSLR